MRRCDLPISSFGFRKRRRYVLSDLFVSLIHVHCSVRNIVQSLIVCTRRVLSSIIQLSRREPRLLQLYIVAVRRSSSSRSFPASPNTLATRISPPDFPRLPTSLLDTR